MITKAELCEKIKSIYPDIGECGVNIEVDFDEIQRAWVVDLKKGGHELKTYLEPEDADLCMAGRQCVGLSIQIAQLRSNIDRM
ncbi:MAG: hypothetical protein V2B19_10480 [Pseudomonadota bacterium]